MKPRHALFVGLVLAMLLAPPVFAESQSGSGGNLSDLWEMAKAAGPFGTCLMLTLFFLERRDRMRLQSERDALLERVLVSINEQTEVVKDTKRAIERSGR